MGELLFNIPCNVRDLGETMVRAKKEFPKLQTLLVLINHKDPVYGINCNFQYNHLS